ncbi:hypothetical protein SK128_021938, partial [Halocaridina rubra]
GEKRKFKLLELGISNPDIHRCKWCLYVTSSAQDLYAHILSHAHHSCPECGLALARPSALGHHLKAVHNIEIRPERKRYICPMCSKIYSSAGALHNHQISIHSDKVFKCKECGREFNHPKNLMNHALRHKGKKLKCKECEATFYFHNELNKHINQVHRKCRPYVCVDCRRYFVQRSVLKHHRMVHSDHRPLTCPLCGRTFKHRSSFSYHLEHEEPLTSQTVTQKCSENSIDCHNNVPQDTKSSQTPSNLYREENIKKLAISKKAYEKKVISGSHRDFNTRKCVNKSLLPVTYSVTSLSGGENSHAISTMPRNSGAYPDIELFENSQYDKIFDIGKSYGNMNEHILLVADPNKEEASKITTD